jgi:prepilin-type N-terminal cleavage/methylation domain-containing protein
MILEARCSDFSKQSQERKLEEELKVAMSRSQRPGAAGLTTPSACGEAGCRSGGFTLLELMIVVTLIAVVAAIAIPSLTQARKSANEASAIASLRTISTSQMHYRMRFQAYATLSDFIAAGTLDESWSDGVRSGYVYLCIAPAGTSTWTATADPQVPGVTGDRYFFIDTSGVIRFKVGGAAASSDSPID